MKANAFPISPPRDHFRRQHHAARRMPAGRTQGVPPHRRQQFRRVDLQHQFVGDPRRFDQPERRIAQYLPKGVGEILQPGALREIAPAAEAWMIKDAGAHGGTLLLIAHFTPPETKVSIY